MSSYYREYDSTIYDAGVTAHGAGDLIHDNPYAGVDGERDNFIDWLAGWCAAAIAAEAP